MHVAGLACPACFGVIQLPCNVGRTSFCPTLLQANAAEYYEIDAARPLRQQLAGKVRSRSCSLALALLLLMGVPAGCEGLFSASCLQGGFGSHRSF